MRRLPKVQQPEPTLQYFTLHQPKKPMQTTSTGMAEDFGISAHGPALDAVTVVFIDPVEQSICQAFQPQGFGKP
jgi:hypothetical protein